MTTRQERSATPETQEDASGQAPAPTSDGLARRHARASEGAATAGRASRLPSIVDLSRAEDEGMTGPEVCR